MRRDARRLRRVPADVLALGLAALLALPASAIARRAIPDTSAAVHVWDDQLPDSMSAAQVRFVARHVDGTQKVSRQAADRLRAIDPAGARRVVPVGGGALGRAASTRGWGLRLVAVRGRVSLPAHSGLVLISSAQG